MSQFSIHEAKTNLSKLIVAALHGEEVVIARGKVPAVRLVPVQPRGERRFGALKGQFEIGPGFFEPLSDDELEQWGL